MSKAQLATRTRAVACLKSAHGGRRSRAPTSNVVERVIRPARRGFCKTLSRCREAA
jgi:hypothetical protein